MAALRSRTLFCCHTLGCLVACFTAPALWAQTDAPLTVDASAPFTQPQPADFYGGAGTAPDGQTIRMNSRYLLLDGKPWLPVMGEFHYSRVPEAQWEEEILKMKAAGVQVIATYVIWLHHEEVKGEFDWSGQRDLHHFVELCAKHGMYVYPRIGPWAHGEARHGGFPDWLVDSGVKLRSNDPAFMAEVARFYAQTGEQLRGQLWKDGGPVIGVQIENEYAARGPHEGAEYILALKKLALASGLDTPLYSVTGWDHAVVPAGEFVPVFGGYPDAPWDAARTKMPPSEVYSFRFGSRVTGNMGMMGGHPADGAASQAEAKTPFLTAEVGGGIEDTYHRRPVVTADDVTAMMPVILGSGVNMYGTYMFHGGENPEGKLTSLQESQATGYPTDVPQKSYDFQAPLSQFGLERESLRKMKIYNYFLNDFGSLLAPMPVFAPTALPHNPSDFAVPRFSVRSDGKTGFLFFNNHVRGASMPARAHAQFAIKLRTGTLQLPAAPIDLPKDSYFIWPFHLDMEGLQLRYATAELMTKLDAPGGPTYVFVCTPQVRCELSLDEPSAGPALEVKASGARIRRERSLVTLTRTDDRSARTLISVRQRDGRQVHLLLLDQHEAENTWKTTLQNQPQLLTTSADFFASHDRLTLRALGNPAFRILLYPGVNTTLTGSAPFKTRQGSKGTHDADVSLTASLPAAQFHLSPEQTQNAGAAPPIQMGPPLTWRPVGVATAPAESTFKQVAARFQLHIEPTTLQGVSDVFLQVNYQGDVARLLSDGRLLDDNFYNGSPWQIGLSRFLKGQTIPPLQLEILPLRADAPVFLEDAAKPGEASASQTAVLKSIEVIPQYQLDIESGNVAGSVRGPHPSGADN